ncbi:hypothetical protein Pcinc_026965 [Petrolisthes cinctipes]|uniref:Uncharacterized protein n=2 Tax=Petrolisthes cinctipes TaxID=88211 RepID=A0AAE1F6E3_PETCI|nr:hypothetical protein Pcinc_026965 [Petrolisthes cinctipes]
MPVHQMPPEPAVNYNHPIQPQYPYSKNNWQENERPQNYQNQRQKDNRWEYGGPRSPKRNNNQFGGPQEPYHNNRQEYVRANVPLDEYYKDGRQGYTRPVDAENGSVVKPWEYGRPTEGQIPRPHKQVHRSASHIRRQDEPQITAQARAWVGDQTGGRDQRTCVEMLKGERQIMGGNNGMPGEQQVNSRPMEYTRNGYKYDDRNGPNQNMNNTRMGDRINQYNPIPYTGDPRPAPYMDRAKPVYYEGPGRSQQYPHEPQPTQHIAPGRPAQYGNPRPMQNGVPRPAHYREEQRQPQYGEPRPGQYIEEPIIPQYRGPRHIQYTGEPRAAPYPGEPRQAQYIEEPRPVQYIEEPRPVQYREPRAVQYIEEPRPAPYQGDPRGDWNMEQDRRVPYTGYGKPPVY